MQAEYFIDALRLGGDYDNRDILVAETFICW
jgi:hypothetical protein